MKRQVGTLDVAGSRIKVGAEYPVAPDLSEQSASSPISPGTEYEIDQMAALISDPLVRKNYGDTPLYQPVSPAEFDDYANGERDMGQFPFFVDELKQIRQEYDPEGLRALAKSLERGKTPPYIWQINRIQINEFDNEADLLQYLEDYRLFYKLDEPIDPSVLHQRPDGTWRILIAGHRRNRALHMVADWHGYTLRDDDVKKDIYNNMSFSEAVAMQGRENEHVRVHPEDAAEDIARHYDYYISKNEGKLPTYVELSQITGYTADRVSQGLKYHRLPGQLKAEYAAGLVSYEDVIRLGRLMEATRAYYLVKHPERYGLDAENHAEVLDKDALDSTLAFCNHLKSEKLRGKGADEKRDVIEAKIRTALMSAAHVQDEIFEFKDDSPAEKRRKTGRRVGEYAINIMVLRLQQGEELSTKEIAQLELAAAMLENYKKTLATQAAELAADEEFMAGQELFA